MDVAALKIQNSQNCESSQTPFFQNCIHGLSSRRLGVGAALKTIIVQSRLHKTVKVVRHRSSRITIKVSLVEGWWIVCREARF